MHEWFDFTIYYHKWDMVSKSERTKDWPTRHILSLIQQQQSLLIPSKLG
uniref:Uncharacterized protein n=1 Tax=Arundo donax TaxID=35708 RepID=A0A0A9E1S8_ARUDO